MDAETKTDDRAAVRAAAEEYCRALHDADVSVLDQLFHASSHLYASQEGTLIEWPKGDFLERVGAREAGTGMPSYEIESVDVAGPEMAHVRLTVSVPPRRFCDYLEWLKIGGEWRIIAKIFRVEDGPAI